MTILSACAACGGALEPGPAEAPVAEGTLGLWLATDPSSPSGLLALDLCADRSFAWEMPARPLGTRPTCSGKEGLGRYEVAGAELVLHGPDGDRVARLDGDRLVVRGGPREMAYARAQAAPALEGTYEASAQIGFGHREPVVIRHRLRFAGPRVVAEHFVEDGAPAPRMTARREGDVRFLEPGVAEIVWQGERPQRLHVVRLGESDARVWIERVGYFEREAR